MNFKANAGTRQRKYFSRYMQISLHRKAYSNLKIFIFEAGGRKLKRVSDVNAMGYNPYAQGPQQSPFSNAPEPVPPVNPYVGNGMYKQLCLIDKKFLF